MTLPNNSTTSNRIKTSIKSNGKYQIKNSTYRLIRFVLTALLCLSLLGSTLQLALPKTGIAATSTYILDKTIKWADGTTEQIQIGSDGFFRINNSKKRLMGMYLSNQLPFGPGCQFYLPDNLIIVDKELAYLESIGVRLIRIDLNYIRWSFPDAKHEEEAYKAFLNLIYKHKMLLIAGIHGKYMPGFNNLENPDFSWSLTVMGGPWSGTDSMMSWAERWATIVGGYQNVIAVNVDNELDYKLKAKDLYWLSNVQDQNYSAEAVERYLTLLTGIIRNKINVPLTHNLMNDRTEPEIKKVCLSKTDIPAFDFYTETPESLDNNLNNFLPWINATTGWWCMELNHMYEARWAVDVNGFTPGFIDSIFNHGAAVAILFWSNNVNYTNEAFFDNNGDPKSQLREVAKEVGRFQAPIVSASIPPAITTADPTNILAQSVTFNSKVTSLGTAPEVKVSFQWGTKAGVYSNETTTKSITTAGDVGTYLSGLNPGTIYFYRAKAASDNTSYGAEKSFTTSNYALGFTIAPRNSETVPVITTPIQVNTPVEAERPTVTSITAPISGPTLISPLNGALLGTVKANAVVNGSSNDSTKSNTTVAMQSKSASETEGQIINSTIPNVTSSTSNGNRSLQGNTAAGGGEGLAVNSITTPTSGSIQVPPLNGATSPGSPITFTWNSLPGTVFYALHVSTSPTFSTGMKFNNTVGTATSYTDTGYSNNGTTYYWRVLAWNGTTWSPSSEVRTFKN